MMHFSFSRQAVRYFLPGIRAGMMVTTLRLKRMRRRLPITPGVR